YLVVPDRPVDTERDSAEQRYPPRVSQLCGGGALTDVDLAGHGFLPVFRFARCRDLASSIAPPPASEKPPRVDGLTPGRAPAHTRAGDVHPRRGRRPTCGAARGLAGAGRSPLGRVGLRSRAATSNRERGPGAEVNAIADAERHPRVRGYGCRIVVEGGAVA